MGIVFSMRGSTVAAYSNGGATASVWGASMTTAADTTAPTGNVLSYFATNSAKGFGWPGRYNTANNRTIAVNICIRHGYTGTPSSLHTWWELGSGSGKWGTFAIGQTNAGNVYALAKNESASIMLNSTPWGTYSASNTSFTDITLMWDGSTSAARLYINSTLYGTAVTPSAAFTTNWNNQYFNEISIGAGNNGGIINGGKVAEFTIWDQTIDVTSVLLTDGTTASLNGVRTAAIALSATIDGAAWTTLAQTNVRNTIVYTAAGVGFTGSVVIPAQASVINGVGVDNSTGTYVTATTANVRNAITFGPLAALTGTLLVPAQGSVINGIGVDNTTGTYVTASAANVRSGTTFGPLAAITGTLAVATPASVISGVSTDNTTGTYVTATTANVKAGVTFGPLASLTGTYTASSVTVSGTSGGSQPSIGWPSFN